MLLRSTSTPVLKSWVVHHASPEMDTSIQTRTIRPASMSLYPRSPSSINISIKKIYRTLSESDLKEISHPKPKIFSNCHSPIVYEDPVNEEEEEEEEENVGMTTSFEKLFSSSGLDESMVMGFDKEVSSLVGGGDDGGDDDDGGSGYWNWDHGNESVDEYYKKMIKAYPGDALILGNYARFLKDVQGDVVKAEGKAILLKPNVGNVFSLYGDLIWQTHKDATRARSYFDQAVQSDPNDCYVLASYAKFLWDAEEEEEEQEQEEERINSTTTTYASPHNFFQKHPPLPPLAAAS